MGKVREGVEKEWTTADRDSLGVSRREGRQKQIKWYKKGLTNETMLML